MPIQTGNVMSWASDADPGTLLQAAKASRLPIVAGHVALMPDAHVGIGATVGSVIPTRGAIIPAAVGVDIGCGMAAVEWTLGAESLPDDLGALLLLVEAALPAGVGKGHHEATRAAQDWLSHNPPPAKLLIVRRGPPPMASLINSGRARLGTPRRSGYRSPSVPNCSAALRAWPVSTATTTSPSASGWRGSGSGSPARGPSGRARRTWG